MIISKAGVHCVGSQRNNYGPFIQTIHAAGRQLSVVKVRDDFGAVDEPLKYWPDVLCIGARTVYDGNIHDAPQTALANILSMHNSKSVIKAWEYLNEVDGEYQAQADLYIGLLPLLAPYGLTLVMFNCSTGTPHYPGADPVPYQHIAWACKFAKDHGHKAYLGLHEYVAPNGDPTDQIGRYKILADYLTQQNALIPIVITEWLTETYTGDSDFMNKVKQYDPVYMADARVLGCATWTLGGGGWQGSNFQTALPQLGEYIATVAGVDPVPPDPPDPPVQTTAGDFAARESLIDGQGHVWKLGPNRIEPGYSVLKDNQHFASGYGVALLFYNQNVYVTNSFADWYQITATGYTEIDDDPRRTIPPVIPPATEPFWVSWPVKSSEAPRITDKFNASRNYANGKHEGLDCDAYDNSTGRNAEIVAAQDGVIEYVLNRSGTGYGLHVVIKHPWSSEPDRYRTLYAHLSSITATVGQNVKRGDKIGVGGATGTSAIHLHFNVHDTQGLKGYIRETDCSANWPEGVIDPETVMRYEKPPEPPAIGNALFGIHCRANGGDLPATEQQAAQQIQTNVKGYKFMTGCSQSHYNAILSGLHYEPSKCMTRLFWDVAGVNSLPTPAQFTDLMRAGINDAFNAGIRAFELLNEVNLYQEWKSTWGGAAGFCDWALQVISQLRSMWPGIQIISPGLAPIGDLAGIGEHTDKWINTFNTHGLFSACNYAGAHAYWGNRAGMTTTADGLNFRRYYTATVKNIWVTEFCNNQAADSDTEKGKQYKDYLAYLRANDPRIERAYCYVLASTTTGENDTRQNWVRNNTITDIVREIARP